MNPYCNNNPSEGFEKPLKSSRRNKLPLLALPFALLGFAAANPDAHAVSVDLDTTTLAGTEARLDFSLLDGDITENNSVTISGLSTDGILRDAVCTVSCTGGPTAFTITDTFGLGQFLQDVKLGNFFHFDLSFTNNFASGVDHFPDQLALALLDPDSNFSLVRTNLSLADPPVQDALLTVGFPGNPAENAILTASDSNPKIGINTIPSPAPWALMLPWVLWVANRCKTPPQTRMDASSTD